MELQSRCCLLYGKCELLFSQSLPLSFLRRRRIYIRINLNYKYMGFCIKIDENVAPDASTTSMNG